MRRVRETIITVGKQQPLLILSVCLQPLKKGLKVAQWDFFSTAAEGWLYSYPKMSSFIHLQRRHAPYRRERHLLAKEGTITKEFNQQIRNLRKHQVLLHAAKLGHGTDSFTSPPKEGMLRIYSETRKIQRLRPGSNPEPEASMLTTRPLKPLYGW